MYHRCLVGIIVARGRRDTPLVVSLGGGVTATSHCRVAALATIFWRIAIVHVTLLTRFYPGDIAAAILA
jgi:hypothetical protein